MSSPLATDRLSKVVKSTQVTIESVALRVGRFDKVQTREPKSAPGSGLTFACWLQTLRPVALASGLAVTSMLVAFQTRIYTNMFREPQDMIDVEMSTVAAELMAEFTANFVIPDTGEVRAELDLLNRHGVPMETRAGYINVDNKLMRVLDTFVPVIAYDVFDQEED